MSGYGGFVRAGEHTDDVSAQQQASGTGVVILAPKQAPRPAGDTDARPSTILNIRKALQKSTGGRARSSDSPLAGRRRSSPVYEAFRPRGSPTYEPLQPRGSPSYEPHSNSAGAGTAASLQENATAARSHSRSRSRGRGHSRELSCSRSSSRDRHKRRHITSRDDKKRRHQSRDRSRSRHRSSRDSKSSKRHKRSRSRSRSSRHRSSSHYSRSRSRDRSDRYSRHSSRSERQRSQSPILYTRQEKSRAWADERAYNADNPVRRGKQGLGFGQQQQLGWRRDRDDSRDGSNRPRIAGGAAGGVGHSSKRVTTMYAAALIPGYDSMTATEKLKARMRIVMSKAEQQGAAAEAAAAGLGAGGLGSANPGTTVTNTVSSNGWTRFVFDQHGELDEDKQARQKLMDAAVGQTAMGGFGNAADDTVDMSAAFTMGTGRVAAQRADLAKAAEAAHDDAIFGRLFGGGSSSAGPKSTTTAGDKQQGFGARIQHAEQQQQRNSVSAFEAGVDKEADGENGEIDAKQLAASLGVSEVLVAEQQKPGMSWRDRALAMKAKRQQ